MAQEAGFGGPFGAQEVSPEGREIVSGGETSRHQGHFRTVFYRSKCVSCCSGGLFRSYLWCCCIHVDVCFVIYFSDQDALSVPRFFCGFRLRRGSFNYQELPTWPCSRWGGSCIMRVLMSTLCEAVGSRKCAKKS